ncbi:hypothetical protein C8J57DRAFT_1476944 [Mycena rebaudengoi]|nr:hypothetical protein C8J57DRAFT_1476944 [Mycena rebaudengoi]
MPYRATTRRHLAPPPQGQGARGQQARQEYTVKDGDTLNMLVKPGTTTPTPTTTTDMASDDSKPSLSIDSRAAPV